MTDVQILGVIILFLTVVCYALMLLVIRERE